MRRFLQPGGKIVGTIVEILPDRQATKFQNQVQRAAKAPRELDFHQNGDPKMTTPVVLQLDPGFAALNSSDTGLRTLYVTEGDPRSKAFRRHAKATRVTAQVGFRLEMTFVGKEQGQGDNPLHIWKVDLLERAQSTGGALTGGLDEDEDDERGTLAATGTDGAPTPTVPEPRRTRRPPTGTTSIG
jgi:hypothetical protein